MIFLELIWMHWLGRLFPGTRSGRFFLEICLCLNSAPGWWLIGIQSVKNQNVGSNRLRTLFFFGIWFPNYLLNFVAMFRLTEKFKTVQVLWRHQCQQIVAIYINSLQYCTYVMVNYIWKRWDEDVCIAHLQLFDAIRPVDGSVHCLE